MGFQDAIIACEHVKKKAETLLEDVGISGRLPENLKEQIMLLFQSLNRITEVLGSITKSNQHETGESSTATGSAATTIIKSEPNDTGYGQSVASAEVNSTNGKRAYAELSSDEISPNKQLDSSDDDAMVGNLPKRQRNSSYSSDENRSLQSEKSTAKPRSHQCSHCDYSTPYRSKLTRHSYTHTDDKPHKCAICLESFIRMLGYKKHMQKRHLMKFPFECSICGEGFEKAEEMQSHEARNKLYQCVECSKSFKHNKAQFDYHMYRQHPHN